VPRPRDVGRVHTSVAAREATASPKPADDLQAIRLLPDARSVNRPSCGRRDLRLLSGRERHSKQNRFPNMGAAAVTAGSRLSL
jgi:hypothetical protein